MNDWDREERELKLASEEIDLKIYEVVKEEDVDVDVDIGEIMSRTIQDAKEINQQEIGEYKAHEDGINKDTISLNMNANHATRLQQARIKSLTNQLENITLLKQEGEKHVQELKAKVHSYQTDNQRLKHEHTKSSSSSISRGNKSKQEQIWLDNLRAENQSLMKENASLRSILKDVELKSQARELRLKRALQSVDKFKQILLDRKATSIGSDEKYRKDYKDLKQKVTDIEKKNKDLLHGFRVQMQLIDVLKRQKIHIEASRMLAFTEKEFQSVLDWGE